MNDRIVRLVQILKSINDIQNDKRIEAIKYGAVSMLVASGVKYTKTADEYVVNAKDETYSVPISYTEAYLGTDILNGTAENQIEIVDDITVDEADINITNLENEISDLYQDIVLSSYDSIMGLKAKILELSEEIKELKRQLRNERDKNRALNDKVNIILRSGNNPAEPKIIHVKNIKPGTNNEITEDASDIERDSDIAISMAIGINADKADNASMENEAAEDKEENILFPYKEDIFEMSKHEFNFIYNRLSLKEGKDVVDSAEILVVPLTNKIKYPKLLVWITHNMKTATMVLEGKNKNVIDLNIFKVTLSGIIKERIFKNYIHLLKEDGDDNKYSLEVSSRPNGTKGHLYLDSDGMKIHICPVTFENNEDGFADFVYCIEDKNGEIIACGDNSEEDVMFFDEENEELKVMVKWQENSLFGAIMLAEYAS